MTSTDLIGCRHTEKHSAEGTNDWLTVHLYLIFLFVYGSD